MECHKIEIYHTLGLENKKQFRTTKKPEFIRLLISIVSFVC